jgi:hypothetical protein
MNTNKNQNQAIGFDTFDSKVLCTLRRDGSGIDHCFSKPKTDNNDH